MGINERIKKLGEYFKKMNIAEGVIFITVSFPREWQISQEICDKYDVKVMPTEDYSGYYYAAKMDSGFDNLFMAIEETITFNEVAGLKKVLFVEKVKELQAIFEEEPLDVLQSIEFKYKKKKVAKKKVDEIEKEAELCQVG